MILSNVPLVSVQIALDAVLRRSIFLGKTPDDLELLGSFSPYALFSMLPQPHERIAARFVVILGRKKRQIADLYAWLSWRIAGSLRKMYDAWFK